MTTDAIEAEARASITDEMVRTAIRKWNELADDVSSFEAMRAAIESAIASGELVPASAVREQVERLQRDCAESYQVIGVLAGPHGDLFDDPQVIKALDNLSAASDPSDPRPHDDLLPFTPITPGDPIASAVAATSLLELRTLARLAWNGWPDNEQSRKSLADAESKDDVSRVAWDRVVAAILTATKPASRLDAPHNYGERLLNSDAAEREAGTIIARAVAAERERCLSIVRKHKVGNGEEYDQYDIGAVGCAKQIEREICYLSPEPASGEFVVVPRTISDAQLNGFLGREPDAHISPMFGMFREFYEKVVNAATKDGERK